MNPELLQAISLSQAMGRWYLVTALIPTAVIASLTTVWMAVKS